MLQAIFTLDWSFSKEWCIKPPNNHDRPCYSAGHDGIPAQSQSTGLKYKPKDRNTISSFYQSLNLQKRRPSQPKMMEAIFTIDRYRGGTMYRFCPRIVVSWHLRRPRTRFRTRFRTRSQTRFRFQHFPEPRLNLVSVFLVIFCFFSPVFSLFSCFFSVFPPVFSSFFPVFLLFRWKVMYLVSYCFPFLAENSPLIPYRFPFLAENSPRIPYRFPFLAKKWPQIAHP